MQLEQTLTIYAGGPGSGCKGSDCGRPSTGPTSTWWHGTLSASAKQIFKEGLRQDPESAWNKPRLKSRKGYVYLTNDKSVAERFAKYRSKYDRFGNMKETFEKPAIVELHLPTNIVEKLQPDPKYAPPGFFANPKDTPAWMLRGQIPKEYVANVEVPSGVGPDGFHWRSMNKSELAAQGITPVYLVYYGDLDLLKRHLRGEEV